MTHCFRFMIIMTVSALLTIQFYQVHGNDKLKQVHRKKQKEVSNEDKLTEVHGKDESKKDHRNDELEMVRGKDKGQVQTKGMVKDINRQEKQKVHEKFKVHEKEGLNKVNENDKWAVHGAYNSTPHGEGISIVHGNDSIVHRNDNLTLQGNDTSLGQENDNPSERGNCTSLGHGNDTLTLHGNDTSSVHGSDNSTAPVEKKKKSRLILAIPERIIIPGRRRMLRRHEIMIGILKTKRFQRFKYIVSPVDLKMVLKGTEVSQRAWRERIDFSIQSR